MKPSKSRINLSSGTLVIGPEVGAIDCTAFQT
jgi:hypothetical protein